MNKDKKILIVGAGLSGLVSSAYLAREGYSVELIEKNNECGGLLNSFTYKDFVFDVGARSIENSGIMIPLLKDLDIDIKLLHSPVSIGIESDIFPFTNLNDINEYKKLLIKKFPNNESDINKIFKVIFKITKSMETMYGFDNPIFTKDFTKNKEYLLKELLPWFPKFLKSIMHMNLRNEPIDEFLKKFTSNQSLIDIISQHFFKKTSTFFALGYFYVYQEYFYPKGGTGKLIDHIKNKIEESGVNIVYNTKITYVDSNKKFIQDEKGNIYNYDKLIWSANIKYFYSILNTDTLNSKEKKKVNNLKNKINISRGGDSVFSLYLGVDLPNSYFSQISNGHFFYTPSKKGLNNIQYDKLNEIIKNFEKYEKKEIINWLENYCLYNTYEISIPSLRDHSLSPDGKTGLIINFFFEYELVKKIKENGWYDEFKEIIENNIISVLENSIYKKIKDNILFKFSFTPLSYENKVNTLQGAITGWTYERPSPAVNKITKVAKSIKTPINNIYQAGQWAYSPAGIPTAILTGWYAADQIIKNK